MCMSCGRGKPDDGHGNADHITRETLQRVAEATGLTLHDAAENVATAAERLL